MAKVAFVSHASEDAAIAVSITDYLERNGVSCWVAPRDVTPGRDYAAEILLGIETSATFVLVLSEHANESIFVKREVERAVSKGKPIFPIRVREVMPSRSLELFISSAHWIDAWQPPIEQYLERLAQSITAAAKVYDAGPAAAPPVAWPVGSKARRPLAAAAAAIALLLLGGAGWYVYSLVRPEGPASVAVGEPAEPETQATGPAEPEGSQGPGAGKMGSAEPQLVNLQPSQPVTEVGPCPQTLAINRDLPTPFRCTCGSEAMHGSGAVWGTDVYTDDSSLCLAALHAGVVGPGGGVITVLRSGGRQLYIGSARNGVASHDFGRYGTSMTFDGIALPSGPEPCPTTLSINRNLPTPFSCTCGSGAASSSGAVWGTDLYTDDSALCLAAVHAGAIGPEGGLVTVQRSEGRPLYVGTARNGVTSHDFGSYVASIRFQ
jgi:TIR domain-containing protein/LCCL domain-containing protein